MNSILGTLSLTESLPGRRVLCETRRLLIDIQSPLDELHNRWIHVSCITRSDGWQMLNRSTFQSIFVSMIFPAIHAVKGHRRVVKDKKKGNSTAGRRDSAYEKVIVHFKCFVS